MINLNEILEKEPLLTADGIGWGEQSDFYRKGYKEQIQTCVDWLQARKTQEEINRSVSSYGIKHIVEKETKKYVANGCFIAAVIHLGIPYERNPGTTNICIAMSTAELHKNDTEYNDSHYGPGEKDSDLRETLEKTAVGIKRKRRYPEHRKPRDVSYSKSYQIYNRFGEERLRSLLSEQGMYVAARQLSDEMHEYVSPYVMRHIRERYLNEKA